MAIAEDLINFDLIEPHKENIAVIPGGRSARQLASILSPNPTSKHGISPTFDETKTLNDAIRQEYELELQSIVDSDDPLDIYDRYVKWTINAYPSAQATPQSQLLPLLERATKAFLTSSHYKNDPRYLKLWLHYIRLFSDAPRETFAFLARHHIGEGLGLFYEEFAAWLEGVGRWPQADEVYKLGIEREARPAERLMRKYNQFQQRFEARPQNGNEPSSPALPTIRPALAAKIDPFSSTPRSDDLQASRPPSGVAGNTGTSRSGKPKMAIFSDGDNVTPTPTASTANGWDSIGSIKDRKKENTIEARPWAGETLKAGKKVGTVPKMEIFKDSTLRSNESRSYGASKSQSAAVNPRTGRSELVFVNLEAVYPRETEEYSFDELRARKRGWADKIWKKKPQSPLHEMSLNVQRSPSKPAATPLDIENLSQEMQKASMNEPSPALQQQQRPSKQRRMKVREVKQETQTVKLRLESPTGPKLKRKNSAEPTMTFHSKAATDEIYDIFNQPAQQGPKDDTQSGDETDFGDDDYSTAGESTGTGRISQTTSEYGDEDTMASMQNLQISGSQSESVSPWSEFTASKHLPKIQTKGSRQKQSGSEDLSGNLTSSQNQTQTSGFDTQAIAAIANQDFGELNTQVIAAMAGDHEEDEEEHVQDLRTPVESELPQQIEVHNIPRYIPLPPDDYEPTPLRPFRDPAEAAQHRLPFMTPIVEKTESSLAPSTVFNEKDYFTTKTPSRSAVVLETSESPSPSKLLIDELFLNSQRNQSPASIKRKRLPAGVAEDELPTSCLQKKVAHSPVKNEDKIPFAISHSAPLKHNDIFKKPTAPAPRTKGPVIKDLQCNPCDPSIRAHILQSVHPSPSSEPGYFDRSTEQCKHYTQLQSYAKQVAIQKVKASPRKSQSEKTLTKAQAPVLDFEGTTRVYAVKKLLGKGAFAPVYLVDSYDPDCSDSDENSYSFADSKRTSLEAIKTDSPPQNSAWEFHILRVLRHRLGMSSRAMQSIVLARECHLFADECYLVLDYHNQGTVLDLVNAFATENKKAGKTAEGVDECLAIWLSVELLRTVSEIHKVGLLHGDLKADNCLVRFNARDGVGPYDPEGGDGWSKMGLTLIDFGRGIDTKMFEEKARFVADWKSSDADCVEIREARPWRSEIDWFGLAGVIHSLLFGKYIDTVPIAGSGGLGGKKEWKVKDGIKRYWQGWLWGDVFHILINSGMVEGGEDGIMREVGRLRRVMEEWLVKEGERDGRSLRKSVKRAEEMVRGAKR